ncbi:glycosyltransferase family 39 protein [Isoptericola sp. b441]|uniref:Glycosyltransferase family 39 protein n=1 Tax=Actinotalea lenta TaxID=3064654 RepID=A0ABT9D7X4_9CELL|nr:glycosyltransferase family 39 protein [Isoptericola sp. b441]MDO8106965.1 glycosyltransferase family 39 protein [Isoptericola sp. b441]
MTSPEAASCVLDSVEEVPPTHGTADAGIPTGRTRPRWELPALAALLLGTAALYLWNLAESGWANAFYSAAAQAGSTSWSAFLYAASDAAASITVDKPPMSIWVMALSVRAFGLSSWSILVPQALMGVATVGALYAGVRRRHAAGTALLAGSVMALTPVAALMFRFNNPDALLVLLLTAAALAVLRAVEDGRTRWMLAAGALVGAAFLTKQLQAFLVLPGFALAYLLAAPVGLARRLRDGVLAVVAMVLTGGWWVALVELVPAADRPWIGGSQTNSFLELTFGYNGLGRITGDETGSVGGGRWGSTGLGRLFGSEIGGQIAWLMPAALVLGLVALWLVRHAPRTDGHRAELLVWGGWLMVTGLTFSLMAGIFHAYYAVALAPAVAVLVAVGGEASWARRRTPWVSGALATTVLGSAIWAVVLLDRSPGWLPWLRPVVLALGALGAGAVALATVERFRRLAPLAAVVSVAAMLAGPTAYSLQTVSTAHTGSLPTAGPAVIGGFGGFGPRAAGARAGGPPGAQGNRPRAGRPGGATGTGFPGLPAGPGNTTSTFPSFGGFARGGAGGLLNASEPSSEVTALLEQDARDYTWVAAAVGSQSAAGYQLATQDSVMPIGGFNGSDPSPTLEEFQALVSSRKIHWFIAGGGLGPQRGGSDQAAAIESWVTSTFASRTVDGVTMYDLTSPV